MSRGERMMRGLEPEQLHAMCANSLQDWGKWKCHDVDVGNRREISGSSSETFVVPV